MNTFKVVQFFEMRTYLALVVIAYLASGCASVPQTLKDIGAELLEQCPKEISLDSGAQSVLLASIETDLLFDEFYLLLENDSGAKYFMMLYPQKLGMPTGDVIKRGRFNAKAFCFVAATGNYHITKILGVFRLRGAAYTKINSEESFGYKQQREFIAQSNKVTYLGRYIFLDPRMKDKGYFERMGQMMVGMFTGLIPNEIDINITDGINEDSTWLLEKHKKIRVEQIINTSH